jgi:hypothetical protein
MDDFIAYMLNAIGQGPTGSTGELTQSMESYNPALYHMATLIHSGAVKPVTSIVIAIIASMMLATNSTRIEGDRELGIKIVAGSMFKVAMVLVACQFAPQILAGIAEIATFVARTASTVGGGGGSTDIKLGDQMHDQIGKAGTMEQLGMLVLLLIPFIVAKIGTLVALILIFIRFLQMFMLSAFASLPIAFLSHEDTKSIGIGYLKKFAVAALTGSVLVIAVKMYQALMGGWLGSNLSHQDDVLKFVVENWGNFLVAPIVLIILLIGANGVAKAIIGEG